MRPGWVAFRSLLPTYIPETTGLLQRTQQLHLPDICHARFRRHSTVTPVGRAFVCTRRRHVSHRSAQTCTAGKGRHSTHKSSRRAFRFRNGFHPARQRPWRWSPLNLRSSCRLLGCNLRIGTRFRLRGPTFSNRESAASDAAGRCGRAACWAQSRRQRRGGGREGG